MLDEVDGVFVKRRQLPLNASSTSGKQSAVWLARLRSAAVGCSQSAAVDCGWQRFLPRTVGFEHARAHERRRLVVCAPFNSILNAAAQAGRRREEARAKKNEKRRANAAAAVSSGLVCKVELPKTMASAAVATAAAAAAAASLPLPLLLLPPPPLLPPSPPPPLLQPLACNDRRCGDGQSWRAPLSARACPAEY